MSFGGAQVLGSAGRPVPVNFGKGACYRCVDPQPVALGYTPIT